MNKNHWFIISIDWLCSEAGKDNMLGIISRSKDLININAREYRDGDTIYFYIEADEKNESWFWMQISDIKETGINIHRPVKKNNEA